MQLFILVYHFTGASQVCSLFKSKSVVISLFAVLKSVNLTRLLSLQVLPVYMFARCLVTSYMFLSAYGNFLYSWNTGDYSVHRYFTVNGFCQ